MTQQEYITTYAPKFATQEAVKTLIATFDEALKIRDKQTAITL